MTSGGRVLIVVGRGATIADARAHAYASAARITFPGVHYRRDIAEREGGREGRGAWSVERGAKSEE